MKKKKTKKKKQQNDVCPSPPSDQSVHMPSLISLCVCPEPSSLLDAYVIFRLCHAVTKLNHILQTMGMRR